MQGASSTTYSGANYRCRNRYSLNKDCPGTSIKALPLDQLIGEVVIGYLSKDRSRKLAARGLKSRPEDERAELNILRQREANLLARSTRMREERLAGLWDFIGGNEAWSTDFAIVTNDMNQVSDRIAELTERDQLTIEIPESWLTVNDVRQLWESTTNLERRQAVTALIQRIEIAPTNPEWNRKHLDPSRVRIARWRVPLDTSTDSKPQKKKSKQRVK